MKNYLSALSVLTIGFFLLSSFSIREKPQGPPRGKKQHVKIIKVEDGVKTVVDTVITNENVFVIKGDSLKGLKSADENLGDLEELKDFDFDIEMDEDGENHKVMIFMSKDGDKQVLKKYKFGDGDDHNKIIIKMDGDVKRMDGRPMIWTQKASGDPHVKMIRKKAKGNVIDLSGPGIISYKKKKLRGGREKIEIIRNEVKDEELHEIDMDARLDDLHGLHKINEEHLGMHKQMKVIKEGENVIYFNEGGEKIKIEKIHKKNGNEVEVKVKVEVDEGKEEGEEENEGHEK